MRRESIHAADVISRRDEIDLATLLGTLWRGKWLILLCTILTMVVGAYYAFALATQKYTSTTTVALENRNSQVVDFESVVSGLSVDQASVNTEVEVLRARILLGRLVDQLNLETDPEFNPWLRTASVLSPGTLLRSLGVLPQMAQPQPRKLRDAVVDEVLGSISIRNLRDSYVFQVSVTTEEAEKSARIADALAELYINEQLLTKFQATEEATAWLTDRVADLKSELEQAETAVKDYNTATDLIGPEALAAQNRQLKDLRWRLDADRRTLGELDAQIDALQAARNGGDLPAIVAIAEDDALRAAATRLGTAGEAARIAFDNRLDAVTLQLGSSRARLARQVSVMESSVAEQKARVEAQSVDLVKLQQLQREATASGLIYEYFLSRLKETSIQQGIQQADSRILSYAVVPDDPSRPRKDMLLMISAMAGLAIGAGLVLGREMRQTGFRSAEDLARATGLTVIGQIPRAPNSRRRKVLDYIASKPTSALVEAVRNLRTSILLSNMDAPPQVIMMTSSLPGEGKTTQTLALAHNLAGLGRRVLVIEGDIRRRTFGEYFDLDPRPGLLSAVSGDAMLEDIVWHSEQLGVDILIGEESTVNAADFFSSGRFVDFIAGVREIYDVVLIDTPPVLVVPDARVIAQAADAVVYVVHWDKTPRSLVEQGLHELATVNVPVTGLVLSQIDSKGLRRYGGSHAHVYAGAQDKYYRN